LQEKKRKKRRERKSSQRKERRERRRTADDCFSSIESCSLSRSLSLSFSLSASLFSPRRRDSHLPLLLSRSRELGLKRKRTGAQIGKGKKNREASNSFHRLVACCSRELRESTLRMASSLEQAVATIVEAAAPAAPPSSREAAAALLAQVR